ncbi:sporulation integral membrane protein YtvI [Sporosarcina sp. YIM B06819]|uniref:sporulation integral membrane protein YtvI n=1 Tax=Sporosarcina sp. YIM B06819 TaxID=3081769 RepID=UPI00298C0E9D|nr:sporulation integral membrane protein YtvI [Sporosarcina sp. YIM B06819]
MTKWLTKRNFILTLIVVITIFTSIFIIPVSIPLIFSLLMAILIEPLVRFVENKWKWHRKIAVTSIFIFILTGIIVILYYTVTQLVGKIMKVTQAVPDYLNSLAGLWIDSQSKLFQYTSILPDEVIKPIRKEFKDIFESMRESILSLLNYDRVLALMTEIPNFLVSFIVFLVALFLLMLELPELKKMLFRHLTTSTAEKVRYMISKINSVIFGFLKAQLLVSLIVLAVTFVGLLLITPKYAIVMSIVIWIIDIIPILGSIIILAPWACYLFISGDVATATKLAILAIILLIIRRTVEPKVMGSQIGLSPLPTLVTMFIGLKLLGFFGLFIGPFIVILFTTAREAGIIKMNFRI